MSVSDPLIKELKGWTRKLTEYNAEIDDDNKDLAPFCKSLEKCIQKGVSMRMNAIGFPKLPEAWYWMEEIPDKNKSYTYTSAVEAVRENCRVRSPVGRLRLLIRICLAKKCLHVPVQILVQNAPSLALDFYEPRSILGDEILGEILLSVLLQSSKLNFKLNLKNASFLDDTWQLPECSALELVPCKTLGISVSFIGGKALVVNLEENSVAAEDEKIELGDILDEINGNVITASAKGKLGKIMKKAIGLPISIHIIKFRYKQSRDFYGPIIHLIRTSGIDHMNNMLTKSVEMKPADEKTGDEKLNKTDSSNAVNNLLKAGFIIKYCGSITTGSEGDVRQIEKAIWRIIRSGDSQLTDVRFECLEIGIRVTQDIDDNIISKHSYMEISSCGRTVNIPDYFAYIAGDTNCNVATKFTAYVFFHQNEDEVQTILQSLGQGFQRTHFAV